MAVPFRFDTVLRVREIERDRCRQALAEAQQRSTVLETDLERAAAERQAVLDELRAVQDGGDWTADRVLARQRDADRLSSTLTGIQTSLQEASAVVARCRQELLEADTAVKALEKLAGRHDADQRRADQQQAERDRDDGWRAA